MSNEKNIYLIMDYKNIQKNNNYLLNYNYKNIFQKNIYNIYKITVALNQEV